MNSLLISGIQTNLSLALVWIKLKNNNKLLNDVIKYMGKKAEKKLVWVTDQMDFSN